MRRITKLGGFIVGIGAGVAALAWVVKDRLLGPESAPVGVADAPAFRVAPGPTSPPPATADDLTAIVGIGPVYRARLERAGISTFAGLAAASDDDIATAAEVPEEKASDWRRQAAQLGQR